MVNSRQLRNEDVLTTEHTLGKAAISAETIKRMQVSSVRIILLQLSPVYEVFCFKSSVDRLVGIKFFGEAMLDKNLCFKHSPLGEISLKL